MLAWASVCLSALGAVIRLPVEAGGGPVGTLHSSPVKQFELVGECSFAMESDTVPGA